MKATLLNAMRKMTYPLSCTVYSGSLEGAPYSVADLFEAACKASSSVYGMNVSRYDSEDWRLLVQVFGPTDRAECQAVCDAVKALLPAHVAADFEIGPV